MIISKGYLPTPGGTHLDIFLLHFSPCRNDSLTFEVGGVGVHSISVRMTPVAIDSMAATEAAWSMTLNKPTNHSRSGRTEAQTVGQTHLNETF